MRGTIYDDVKIIGGVSVAPASMTAGTSTGASVDTLGQTGGVIRAYGAQTSSNPSVATLAVTLQESADGSTSWSNALDNTGAAIGFTLNCQAAAAENIARIEGLGINRKRYLRAVVVAAFTGGTTPAILGFAEIIMGGPAQQMPTASAVSNT